MSKPTEAGDKPLYVDIYMPETGPAPATLIYVHPGAFSSGSRKLVQEFLPALLAREFNVLSFDYRLAGDAAVIPQRKRRQYFQLMRQRVEKYGVTPRLAGDNALVALEDFVDFLNWGQDNLRRWRINPENLIWFGDSAGGISVLNALFAAPLMGWARPEPKAAIVLSGSLALIDFCDVNSGPPLLWIHGEGDRRVSSESALKMRAQTVGRLAETVIHLAKSRAHGTLLFDREIFPGADPSERLNFIWDFAARHVH